MIKNKEEERLYKDGRLGGTVAETELKDSGTIKNFSGFLVYKDTTRFVPIKLAKNFLIFKCFFQISLIYQIVPYLTLFRVAS